MHRSWAILAVWASVSLPAAASRGWLNFDRIDVSELDGRLHVSVVYADQNLKSPASMFGHTFLVFHDEIPPEPDAPAVEFLGDSSTAAAELKAVFLNIPGRFHLSRFLFMQREYDLEDRGLAAYVLRLSAPENARMASEARKALGERWNYNFIQNNCSYQLLALILRALPDEPGYGDFPFVLPSNTIRALQGRGRIEQSIPLASSLHRLEEGYARLSLRERAEFEGRAAGLRSEAGASHPLVASTLLDFVRYQAPRESDGGRRNALFVTAASMAVDAGRLAAEAPPPKWSMRDPAQINPTFAAVGWRGIDSGVATATIVPALRSFEHTADDGLRNSTLEIGRASVFFRPGRFGVAELRVIHLDAQQPGSRFGAAFTRFLDLSFEKDPNRDWSLHDEYRAYLGAGTTLGEGPLAASATLFTGPRYAVFRGQGTFLWDVGLKAALHAWIAGFLHLRSELKWIPLASIDRRGQWSNLAAINSGRFTLAGGLESPAGDPLNIRGIATLGCAF